ncbi:MAG: hypothetical protein ACJAT2_000836 [Bacteriovoracaceae bacterium]|jgi:hypothetical protein
MMNKKLAAITALLMSTSTFAAGLGQPIALPSAKVLPKGVRNFTYKGVITNPDQRFNGNGDKDVLADKLIKRITFGDMIAGQYDPVDKGSLEQKMLAIGANENTEMGETVGQVNMSVQANVPIFALGLTKKHTVAVAIPVTRYSTNVATGVRHTNPGMIDALRQELSAETGSPLKSEEFDEKFGDPINAKLAEYNYERLENENDTKLGDIKLVSKYKAFEGQKSAFTLVSAVTLPTGKEANPDKVIDIGGGDGQTDLELGFANDFYANKYFTFTAAASHTLQFSDTVGKRVPFTHTSSLSPDVDRSTYRDLGDISKAELSAAWNYYGINLGAGYAIQYKQGDEYSGDQFESSRYELLEKDSVQNMQTLQITAGYDTISLFKAGKFFAPMKVSVGHSRVLAGKNVVSSPLTTIDFSMFF